jgi:tetratricopeptide (TPR) repeat protein
MKPWFDEIDLLPGQDWNLEIRKAIRECHIVLVCLSSSSISKVGYLQKEIRHVLDVADEQPEGSIFLIPVRLEKCDVPDRLRRWQWVNLYEESGYERLMLALTAQAQKLTQEQEGGRSGQIPVPSNAGSLHPGSTDAEVRSVIEGLLEKNRSESDIVERLSVARDKGWIRREIASFKFVRRSAPPKTTHMYRPYEDLFADLNRTLELNPNNAHALETRGVLHLGHMRYEDALNDFNRALELDPNRADTLSFGVRHT